ncbi:hypothetical protein FHS29_003957 [Saccharothrix tamanrassetensis]|uniref:Uncharacterized protein n=1 Tax=Saccharothrix tamanrassetensis TaxID=1051531 RepID=A0A841CFQ3_9PSEU|nr:hypothetical protein [Saccharothrix tamanrassetensis]
MSGRSGSPLQPLLGVVAAFVSAAGMRAGLATTV